MSTVTYIRYPSSSISGTVSASPAGLKNGGRVTEVTLNSATWTALPPTPLTARNALAVQNSSGIEIKVNYSAGIAGYHGIIIAAGSERSYDITDAIVLYAKSASGTPTINVEELS